MEKETAMEILRKLHDSSLFAERTALETIIPELAESEDEKIRKALVRFHKSTIDIDGIKGADIIAWLEKQSSNSVKWQKNTSDNKPAINHSVLMKTTQGIAEGEWNGKEWIQYRWLCTLKDNDVLAWMELSDLDEQGEQKPFDYESANILQKDFASKQGEQKFADNPPISRDEILYQLVQNGTITAFDYLYLTRRWNNTESPKNYQDIDPQQKVSVVDFNAKDWYVSKVDGKIHDLTYNPTDKVEPRFKVKYAGSEYNVLEVKDIAGVTFYGIEDEPNHIDYVKAENCEIINGYAIKENSSLYPTKPAVFSEKKPAAWSDEDENYLQSAENACEYQYGKNTSTILWLKSLKNRIGG